ncbi:cyclic nucleotide-binding domain protein (macronuclear) [Tetrahymena thermophila SB210]|uniref:Cyclic nucleotide-binding domain protein n=1 Tax=Tetrahymena thermophila (strain SB210) TaxID=312017 RepID=I7MDE7_TETTS|nr:cyclic nucleotide-binding domain protein [Tetrahymena thermophila SB210]EAR87444.2 cyclic nucleotide-binding domain protein [Tetrahymena thermophila SB210]|eukprot:XP_001007689.2 cyclic nucleotide-binding domain protein [Tetrahymena thermophila SB210]
MSLNTTANDSNQAMDKLRELIQILQLNGNQRKKQHINFLMDVLQIIPFFIKFREEGDEFTQRLFCKYIKYEYYNSSQLVFRTGQQGDSFYIILAGKVGIYAEKNQMINIQDVVNGFNQDKEMNQDTHDNIKLIKVLDAGASFGEMALYEDNSLRVSTVFAHTDTFLGVIKREDYLNIIQKKEERERQKTIQNLINMSLFQGWNMKEISNIAEKMKTIHCKKEEIIYQENQQIQSVFIVLNGTFLIAQNDEIDEWDDCTISVEDIMKKEKKIKKQKQKLRLLQVHELFGEEELFQNQNKRIHKVVCISDKATLFQMDIFTFENDILNKNVNTKQEIIKRVKVKLEDLQQNQDKELQQTNDYQSLMSKNYKTILLKFNNDENGQMQNLIEKSSRRLDKNENKINSVCNIQDAYTNRKNTKIVVSKKQVIRKGRYLNQSLNYQQTRQNSLENINQESNILLNGYEADQMYIDQDTLQSHYKNKTSPMKEKNSIVNEINSDLPKLYQKVKASIIQQSDTSKNPNSFVLQNPDSFILNFLPSMNKELTHKMEQIHNQKNQELQENILKKIQRTKTTESSNKIQNNKIDLQNEGVKGSQIFGNFDQLQRKKKIMIEKAFYYRQNEQNGVQQQKLQQIVNNSSNNQKQNYPLAVILPNKLYKEEKKRSNSINTISKIEDQQYKQSLKKYLLNQVQQSNRDKVNEMYNTEIQSLEVINNCSDSILVKNNSSFSYNKRLSERQSLSQRTSPKHLQRKRLQPLN